MTNLLLFFFKLKKWHFWWQSEETYSSSPVLQHLHHGPAQSDHCMNYTVDSPAQQHTIQIASATGYGCPTTAPETQKRRTLPERNLYTDNLEKRTFWTDQIGAVPLDIGEKQNILSRWTAYSKSRTYLARFSIINWKSRFGVCSAQLINRARIEKVVFKRTKNRLNIRNRLTSGNRVTEAPSSNPGRAVTNIRMLICYSHVMQTA
jgi:hypothetical protein